MNRTDIQIEAAIREKAEIVSSILYKAFINFKPLYTQEAFDATAITPMQVLKRMDEGPVLLASINDEAVGTVSIVKKHEGYYIRGMAVLQEARGQHIGWRLLEKIEADALSEHSHRMFLRTTPFLTSAIALYSRFGFKKIGNEYENFFGTSIFTMEKCLKTN